MNDRARSDSEFVLNFYGVPTKNPKVKIRKQKDFHTKIQPDDYNKKKIFALESN